MATFEERRLNGGLIACGLLLVCAGVVAASRATGVGPFADRSHCEKYEVGREAWQAFRQPGAKDVAGDGISDRQQIADELADCGTLDGRKRSWVESRLGRGSAWTGPERGRVTYTLGLCTHKRDCLFTGDTEFLDVYYDGQGSVERVTIYDT